VKAAVEHLTRSASQTLPSPPPSAKGAHVWRAVSFPLSDARFNRRAGWQGV